MRSNGFVEEVRLPGALRLFVPMPHGGKRFNALAAQVRRLGRELGDVRMEIGIDNAVNAEVRDAPKTNHEFDITPEYAQNEDVEEVHSQLLVKNTFLHFSIGSVPQRQRSYSAPAPLYATGVGGSRHEADLAAGVNSQPSIGTKGVQRASNVFAMDDGDSDDETFFPSQCTHDDLFCSQLFDVGIDWGALNVAFVRLSSALEDCTESNDININFLKYGSNGIDSCEANSCSDSYNDEPYEDTQIYAVCDSILNARDVTSRLHSIRCNSSYTCFCSSGRVEVDDDWSKPRTIVATATIQNKVRMFILECAGNATADMVCSFVHNFIVASICRFTFTIDITGTEDDTLIADLEDDAIEFIVTELVSHNGCLHPIGEPCFCADSD